MICGINGLISFHQLITVNLFEPHSNAIRTVLGFLKLILVLPLSVQSK